MDHDYYSFVKNIHNKLNIDLYLYKENQMKRRLTTLKNKRGFLSFKMYYEALIQDRQLLEEFIDRITINVTEFYRNSKRWDILQKKVFPKLIENSRRLNIWSAACSTGEEPYSIALMLTEYFPQVAFNIIATDLDDKALLKAKQGTYIDRSLQELPYFMKRKYFKKDGSFYTIDQSIKQHVTFKQHNLLNDRYPRNIDLIVCRNVLIYFTDAAKQHVYQNFSRSLKSSGVLFVGSTEQIFHPSQYNLKVLETFFYKKFNPI